MVWLGMVKALFKLHPESLRRLPRVDETLSVTKRGKVKSLKEWKKGLVLGHHEFGILVRWVFGFVLFFFFQGTMLFPEQCCAWSSAVYELQQKQQQYPDSQVQ